MVHHYHRWRWSVAALSICVLAACTGSRGPVVQGPPAAIRIDPTDTDQIAVRTSASSDEPAQRAAPVDPLAGVLIRVQELSSRAEEFRQAGNIEQAQQDLEAALDLLWDYSRLRESNAQVEREIDRLMTLLGTFDPGVRAQRAAIDDLAELDVSSRGLDPTIKEEAEADMVVPGLGLPIQLEERVLAFLEYYTDGRGRRSIQVGLERAGLYRAMIQRILAEEGLPEDLIHLAQAESAFQPQALSRAAAKGLWQFIPSRGREYGLRQNAWIDERSDPEKSTRAAARHLKDLYTQFGDWYLAMAAYNAGPARVQRAIERAGVADFWKLADENLLPRETRNYVPTILAMTLIGRNPLRYGFQIEPSEALEVERVPVDQATDLRIVADALQIPVETLHELNPHVLRWATPPEDQEFELILPQGYRTRFEESVTPLSARARILFYYHVVTSGETVSHLSQRYGVSIAAIADTNGLNERNTIRIGQSLIIPLSEVPVPDLALAETSAPQTPPEIYRVRRGDTLSTIAEQFRLSVADIRSWNNMTSSFLLAGATLRLTPPPGAQTDRAPSSAAGRVTYRVRSGDTLTRIADSYQTSVDAIRTWNLGLDLSVIRPGDQLTIYCATENVC